MTTDTIDTQLAHLAELHDKGELSDEEFVAAKKSALSEQSSMTSSVASTPTVIDFRFTWNWILLAAVVLGGTFFGLGSVLEWAGVQQPAAFIVCQGGTFHPGFDVAYSMAASSKGVNLASTCVRDGVVQPIPAVELEILLSVIYVGLTYVVLLALRTLRRMYKRRKTSEVSL